MKQGRVAESFWPYQEAGHNQDAKKELLALMEADWSGPVFDTPKPTKLLRRILQIATTASDDIVVDFFAGSATTGDAVLQQNAEDGGRRRFILVQLPDSSVQSVPQVPGIAALARERIRRAGIKVRETAGLSGSSLDTGFRALRIDSGSWIDVLRTPDDTAQTSIDLLADNIKPDRGDEDLLFQVMIDWGLDLALPIERDNIVGVSVLNVDSGGLLACFEESLSVDLVRGIASRNPVRVVFRDSSFESDAERINVEQIFREVSKDTQVKVI